MKRAKERSFEGAGIGLSLVQELVKLHSGTITVSSTEGKGSCFKVSIPKWYDTGCGISTEELPYIFDTFRQASASNKGLRLGLAIARRLVELHNGTIYAKSSGVGQGATSTVKLPVLQE